MCDDALFNATSRRYTINYWLRIKIFCKQGGKLHYSRYSEVSLLILYYHWQTLSISFLLEIAIAKDPSYLSLQYFMYSVTVAYHLTLCSNNISTHNDRMKACLPLSFFFICTNQKRIPYKLYNLGLIDVVLSLPTPLPFY